MTISLSPDLTLREKAFATRIQQTPCATPHAAMQFVRFGLHCIRETPLTDGLTPEARVADAKQLTDAIERVESWLTGEEFGHLHDDVRAAATKEGPYKSLMTGRTAACWSICHLYEAVRAVIRAGKDVSDLNDVGMNVGRSVAFARSSSDEGVTLPAIEFQEQLMDRMFGAVVAPVSAGSQTRT